MRGLGIITLAVAALFGCKKQAMDTQTVVIPADTVASKPVNIPGQITYLALGDSYTIGESVPQQQSFPYQLASQLRVNKVDAKDPVIIARTGWTTQNLKQAIIDAKLTSKFSFVTLLIGVNNQYQHFDIQSYPKDFDDLVNTAISFANADKTKVFVLSIPDYSVTPFASAMNPVTISNEIDQYNAINKAESEKLGVNYLDITAISRSAKTDPTLIADDGLHPSGKMYMYWVNNLLPLVLEKLSK